MYLQGVPERRESLRSDFANAESEDYVTGGRVGREKSHFLRFSFAFKSHS